VCARVNYYWINERVSSGGAGAGQMKYS